MLSLWFEDALLAEGWARRVRLTLDAGRITGVERDVARAAGDEAHGVAIPGLANAHSHAFQRGMAGLAERRGPEHDDFWTWREVMYRFLDRLTPDDVEAITAQAFAEMLSAGFTRVGEFHYLHNDVDGRAYANPGELTDRIVAARDATGIGMTLLPVFYAHGGFGGSPPKPGQRRFLSDPDGFARLVEHSRAVLRTSSDAVVGIAPHSLRAVTPEELAEILPLAGGGPTHIHAAEQTGEVADCVAWSGARPVQWLLDHVPVGTGWCLIHTTHLDEAETAGLARSGAVAGLCPITEANLGDGIFPARRYLDEGGRIAVGTDSNVFIDAGGELRALEYAQRLEARSRNLLAPREGVSVGAALFANTLSGGAQALGAPPGELRVGASADIVALDPEHPALLERHGDDLLDAWVFAAGREAVASVWRAGDQVVAEGEHRNAAAIRDRYRATLRRLLSV
ncbi:MAG TPA: formimidoylglutamate deiminase [Caulobacteraceae bacterium]|nr:formimidoylglutamate deiminase [Caulobacteraceae bacterium]